MKRLAMWWRWEGKHIPRNIRCGIKNILRWIPTIYRDRDWDQSFIYEVLAKKLEHQSKYIGEREWHTRAKRDAEVMRLVIKLIRAEQEDTYSMEYMDYHESEFNFTPTDETEQWFNVDINTSSENYEEYFKKYSRQYKMLMAGKIDTWGNDLEDMDDKTKALIISQHNQARCRKLLFKIIEQNISGWWD